MKTKAEVVIAVFVLVSDFRVVMPRGLYQLIPLF